MLPAADARRASIVNDKIKTCWYRVRAHHGLTCAPVVHTNKQHNPTYRAHRILLPCILIY